MTSSFMTNPSSQMFQKCERLTLAKRGGDACDLAHAALENRMGRRKHGNLGNKSGAKRGPSRGKTGLKQGSVRRCWHGAKLFVISYFTYVLLPSYRR